MSCRESPATPSISPSVFKLPVGEGAPALLLQLEHVADMVLSENATDHRIERPAIADALVNTKRCNSGVG